MSEDISPNKPVNDAHIVMEQLWCVEQQLCPTGMTEIKNNHQYAFVDNNTWKMSQNSYA